MSGTSSWSAVDERAALIEEHRVGWRLGPLKEHVKGHGVVQTGYELVLFGRFNPSGLNEPEAVARALHEGLRVLALEAFGPAPPDVVLCFLPLSHVVVPAEDRSSVAVELTVTGSPAHPGQPLAPAELRQRIAALAARLQAMGLHRG